LEFHRDGEEEPVLEFHSHFADKSKQNAATTNAHMEVLFDYLIEHSQIGKSGATMWDDTDGCSKQYRCGKAFWCLSFLASKYGRVIDRAIGAPGHGKGMVDGVNGTDKNYLARCMCFIGNPEEDDESSTRMAPESMSGNGMTSFASECARLCGLDSRIGGVKGGPKHKKREASARLKMRHYHIQNDDDVKYKFSKYVADSLPKSAGVLQLYNVRADPDLGVGTVAMRRIPCGCTACTKQLDHDWVREIHDAKNQPRYATASDCKYTTILEGFNDWFIVKLKSVKATDTDSNKGAQKVLLADLSVQMAELVEEKKFGAFSNDDPGTVGYYLVQWLSVPYALQEDEVLTDYVGGTLVKAGELVVQARYFNSVPSAKNWYTISDTKVTVRMQQVVAADIEFDEISADNPLPNRCNVADAKRLGAKRLVADDHDDILEEIHRRELFCHNEVESADELEPDDELDDLSHELDF